MPQAVFVFIVPDLASGQWRSSFRQVAEKAGWSVHEAVKPVSLEDLETQPKTLWLSENPELFPKEVDVARYYTQQPASNIADLLCRMAPDEDESHVAGRATYFLSQREAFRKQGASAITPGKTASLHADFEPIKLDANPPSTIAPYLAFYDPRCKTTEFELPISSFRLGERHSNYQGMDFDLLGPSRSVLRGPYFYLPKGRWTVQLEFTVHDHTAPIGFQASWPSHDQALVDFKITDEGVYRIELTGISSGTEPCVLNISTTHSVLYGVITPTRLVLTRA